MRYPLILAAICCCLSLASHAQYQHLLHKTHTQRAELLLPMYHDTLINSDSVTIFTKIDAIKKLAADNHDEELLLEAGLLRVHYFYYRHDRFPASLTLPMLDSLKNEGIKRKKRWLEALAENMEALYNFTYLKQYELGFEHHQRVYDLIKDLSPEDFPQKQYCLYQMAAEYYFFNDFRETIFYCQEALKAEPPEKFPNNFADLNIRNTIGLCYQHLQRLDSADYYFRQTLAIARQKNNEAWEGISSGNLGHNAFLRKEYDKAIPLLEKDFEIAIKGGDSALISGSLMLLADINLIRQQINKAAVQLQTARPFVYHSHQYFRRQQLYPLLSKLYTEQNQPALAALYLDSALFVKDSFIRNLNSLQQLRAKQKIKLEQYRAEIDRINNRKQINKLERNILLVSVFVIMIASVYFYREQRRKYHRKQERFKKTEEELAAASRQLNDFAKNISEKNKLIELLQQQADGQHEEVLQQLQQSTILTESDWEYFRELFEKVNNGYLQRLREKVPGLTPAEIRFMALSKLRISSREMAGMLGVGADAIRQYRSRIRKKLNLGEDSTLDELVNSI